MARTRHPVYAVGFSPDNRWQVTGSLGKTYNGNVHGEGIEPPTYWV
jgi:hypothetical protein